MTREDFDNAVEDAVERRMNDTLAEIMVEHEDKVRRRVIQPMLDALQAARAAISSMDEQISQMADMFDDEDGQISAAVIAGGEAQDMIDAIVKRVSA